MAKINFQIPADISITNKTQSDVPVESMGPVKPKNGILKVRFGDQVTIHSFNTLQQTESDDESQISEIGTVESKATDSPEEEIEALNSDEILEYDSDPEYNAQRLKRARRSLTVIHDSLPITYGP